MQVIFSNIHALSKRLWYDGRMNQDRQEIKYQFMAISKAPSIQSLSNQTATIDDGLLATIIARNFPTHNTAKVECRSKNKEPTLS